MNTCDVCGKKEILPYKCSYCGGTYCAAHRLPERHQCTGEYWNVPVKIKEREKSGKESKFKMPKIPFPSKSNPSRQHKIDYGDFPQPSRGLGAYGYNNIIIGICTVFFLISIVFNYSAIINFLALNPDKVIYRPWQFITSIFLHVSFWHFFVNMIVLFFFGTELERRVGGKMYLLIFFLAGVVGNLAYLGYASLTNPLIPALGASGAIYGVLGTLALIAPEIRVLFFFAIPMSIRTLIILFAIVDILGFVGSFGPGIQTGVAHSAHLAGLLVGLYYGKRLKIVRRWRMF